MAIHGRSVHAVSARTTPRADAPAPGDGLTSAATSAAFVCFVVLVVVAIVAFAPQEAGRQVAPGAPQADAGGLPEGIGALAGDFAGDVDGAAEPAVVRGTPRSKPPERLKGYRWPLSQGRIKAYFDFDEAGFLAVGGRRIHGAIDIYAYCGAAVRAAHSGTVLAAGRRFHGHTGFSGPLDPAYERLKRRGAIESLPLAVVIDDGNGYRSVYSHLASTSVKPGQRVQAGDVIGFEGATGDAIECQLQYELVRMDGAWMGVAPELVQRGRYPEWVRERIDPLRVLSLEDPAAPRQGRGVASADDPPRPDPDDGPVD